MTGKLTISAKKLDPKVNYIPFSNNNSFLERNRMEEVVKLTTSTAKKVGIFASTLGIGMIPNIASASTVATSEIISPQVIFQLSLKVALIGLGVSFGVAMIMLILMGILKMFKKRQLAKEWTTDIYKGFVHCLVTIPTIFALYYIATTLFGQLNISNETFLNFP